jgi:anthraniloyl-CoA monooxygenase
MRIACVGGGPAGLYFAVLSKLRDPYSEVTVLERNRRGIVTGWGIVFWQDLLTGLRRTDPPTAKAIRAAARQWHSQQVRVLGKGTAQLGGYGFSISRALAIDILTERALDLGVRIEYEQEIDPSRLPDADLVVASDGAASRVRTGLAGEFGPTVAKGRNYYIWLGTGKVFESFTFSFVPTPAGWIWFHAYRFDPATSTCIVECPPATWQGLQLGERAPREVLTTLAEIFADDLDGHPLRASRAGEVDARWLNFGQVTNQRWYAGNVVLMGDAAHTTHFSIGSGTKLALQDAMGLDQALRSRSSLPAALELYHTTRSTEVARRQRGAWASQQWFENVPAHIDTDVLSFGYRLRTRRDLDTAPSRLDWLLYRATQYRAGRYARRWVGRARRSIRPTT